MTKNYFIYYNGPKIIITILLLGTFITQLVPFITESLKSFFNVDYLAFPSTAVILGIIITLIDKYLWNKFLFKYLYEVKDISGRYEGNISFKHYLTGEVEQRDCAIEIRQTGSSLQIRTYFKDCTQGTSYSITKDLKLTIEDNHYTIFMIYHNLGNSVLNIPEHHGTNILDYSLDNKTLTGRYYTDKEPQTKGIMTLNFTDKNFKNRY